MGLKDKIKKIQATGADTKKPDSEDVPETEARGEAPKTEPKPEGSEAPAQGEATVPKSAESGAEPEEYVESEYLETILCSCPLCSQAVESDALTCDNCGAVFERDTYECPFCSTMLNEKLRCMGCGRIFSGEICPHCNSMVERGADMCHHCHHKIEGFDKEMKKVKLKHGNSYLIKEEGVSRSLRMFADTVKKGYPGIGISRIYPRKLKENYGFRDTPLYWLTTTSTDKETTLDPRLPEFDIALKIGDFLKSTVKGVVLIEGLATIITECGFNKTLGFVTSTNDTIAKSNAMLIAPIHPTSLSPEEMGMLESVFDEVIEEQYRYPEQTKEEEVKEIRKEITREIMIYEGGRGPGKGRGKGLPGGPGGGDGEGKEEDEEEEEGPPTPRRKTKTERILFPFAAIIGQDVMKRALLLNAINPLIGGVLIEGHRGTAKSVAVRGLSELLPEIEVVTGCRFNCDPKKPKSWCWECKERAEKSELPVMERQVRVVDLPLNATEDRVVGTLDIEKVMKQGLRAFEEGLLAEANRGVLYIDEINLLDDYVVDVLLDAAAMGVCSVEREAVSVSYPARFILVGSMNPEEGKLRPQLLDRMALMVPVKGLLAPEDRVKIVELREEFTRDAMELRKKYEPQQEELRQKIRKAQESLNHIKLSEDILEVIAEVALSFKVDGHRADIMMQRTAQTNAAFEGRTSIIKPDIIMAANMVLPHRMRKGPLEEEEFNPEHLKELIDRLM